MDEEKKEREEAIVNTPYFLVSFNLMLHVQCIITQRE